MSSDLSAFLRPHAADHIGDRGIVAANTVGRYVGTAYAARGYRVHVDDYAGTSTVYRPGAGDVLERVPYRALLDSVRTDARAALEAATELPTPSASTQRGAARSRATADLLRTDARGCAAWLRKAAEAARDSLPELADDELPQRAPAPRRATAPTDETRAARRASAAAGREADEAELARVLERWLPRLEADELPLPDVWAAWTSALADLDPNKGQAVRRIGRTRFYAVLAHVRPVRSTGARRRVATIRPTT